MFVGHFTAGIAAKAAEDRVPLWVFIGASQLLDLGWAMLVIAGVEKVRIDPALPGSPLDLYHMPWTHSLPAALLWSLAAALVAWRGFGMARRAAAIIAAVVFSHWLLDLVVHRPDLALWPGGTKVGLALWDRPLLALALEMTMLALIGGWWMAVRRGRGEGMAPGIGFLALLAGLQFVSLLPGTASSPPAMAALALFGYGAAMAGAAVVDWHDARGRRVRAR